MADKIKYGRYAYGGAYRRIHKSLQDSLYQTSGELIAQTFEKVSDNSSSGSGPYPPKSGSLIRKTNRLGRVNGTLQGSIASNWYQYYNYAPNFLRGANTGPSAYFMSWNVLKTQALATMMASQPIVDLPTFIYELRELPAMIRDAGNAVRTGFKTAAKNPGGAYLSYSFGWSPLISDLRKLINLGQEIDKRAEQLKRWKRQNRAEGSLGSSTAFSTDSKRVSNGRAVFNCSVDYFHKTRAWYTAKFTEFNTSALRDNGSLSSFATALGSRQPLSTVWNSLPWTWLIDYFVNVGSFIAAYNNTAYYDLDFLCIMQRTECKSDAKISIEHTYPSLRVTTQPSYKHVAWERRVYYDQIPAIGFKPILTGGQIANIAALLASRSR